MKLEFQEGSSFHRLVDEETGEVTQWADYNSFTYLNGYVGHTAFFGTEWREGICTAEEFCKMMEGVGKLEDEQEENKDAT